MSRPVALELDGVADTLGLYSHAFAAPPGSQLVAVAGQLAVEADGQTRERPFEEQMRMVVESLNRVLGAFGGLDAVLKFTTYLTDERYIEPFYEERSRLWPRYFSTDRYPPNTLLVVKRLVRPEFLIEIEAIAVAPAGAVDNNRGKEAS